ncbi:hypothetical protein IFM89_035264 [Coptis chinensis]|uniref:Uncharacterized protein n=1 Tax=Coptis chinensis TaxID=261450 RepID=A0A835GZR3_9MAGN|nr:hypothetical protein IFM89_035264 [Coptis chinensis]
MKKYYLEILILNKYNDAQPNALRPTHGAKTDHACLLALTQKVLLLAIGYGHERRTLYHGHWGLCTVLAFCNSYGCGLTDWSLASSYGKVAILVLAAWVGDNGGGVAAGLAACGVMMNIVSTAANLMQDFKTGYLTLSSAQSMFCSQIIGTVYIVALPLSVLRAHLCYPSTALTFASDSSLVTIVLNIICELLAHYKFRVSKFIPSPMAMAVPFYLGGYFVIDMCVGSLIRFVWEKKNKANADAFVPATAPGLIFGDRYTLVGWC